MITAPADHLALVIRRILAADQAAARRLILEGLADRFGAIDASLNPDLDDIAASYTNRGHLFLVADAGGRLVGTGALVIEDALVGRIVRVTVERRHRGRGVGRTLVAHLLDAARQGGLGRIWVETNDDWTEALALYRSCGFAAYDWRDGQAYLELWLAEAATKR